jgi:FkbM family methyltransferase
MLTDLVAAKASRALEAADITLRLTKSLGSRAVILSCYAAILRDVNDASEVAFDLVYRDQLFPIRMRRSDIFTLAEIFYAREYAIHTPLPERPLVLDCGANVGLSPIWFLGRYGARVHAFEPEPNNFRLLEINAGGRNDVVVNQAAVGKTKGKVDLHVSSHGATHSVKDASAGAATVSVDGVTLADYLEHRSLEKVDVLKLDVEGSEMDVLEGLGGRLRDIRVIVGELHERFVDAAAFYRLVESFGFRRVRKRPGGEAGVHLFEVAR